MWKWLRDLFFPLPKSVSGVGCSRCHQFVAFSDAVHNWSVSYPSWRHVECPSGAVEAHEQEVARIESGYYES